MPGRLLAGLLVIWAVQNVCAKVIRLREGEIRTDVSVVNKVGMDAPTSGLFLIQFTEPIKPAWRKQLDGMGVDLINYVPEDAFVARLRNVRVNRLRQLDFVQWIGLYHPEQKLHPALRTGISRVRMPEPIEVSILLAPRVSAVELAGVRQCFLSIAGESHQRFGSVIRGSVAPSGLKILSASDVVLWIEPAPRMRLFDEAAAKIVAGDGGVHRTSSQALGYDGSNVVVAVVDSGLHTGETNTMHPDLFGRVAGFRRYGSLTDDSDGNGHGTHVAGIIAGNGATGETDENNALYGLGVVSNAQIFAQKTFDANGGGQFPDYGTLASDAVNAGAVIGCNSWGNSASGNYDTDAREFDGLVRDADVLTDGDQPYILVFAAGNFAPNPQTIASPAAGKNVIAVGASQNSRTNLGSYGDGPEAMYDRSGRGPCADGRIKPDLVAPGAWIASLRSAVATNIDDSIPISSNYVYLSGTSQSAPQVAGAAAVFVQYYRQTHTNATPSPALVKAALINSAHDLDNSLDTAPVPNMDEGWGRVDLTSLIGSDRAYAFLDQTELLTTGQTYERTFLIGNTLKPLRVTLAYTDVPGSPMAASALVNDLDLEIISPDGHIYHGNQFDGYGESIPDATDSDGVNNVEGIYISAPLPGEYLVRVYARNAPQDARADTPDVDDQDFALVISGDIPRPSDGVVLLDRQVYTAPGKIQITVIDTDQTNISWLTVSARSTTETEGEPVVLSNASPTGVFTGAVFTAIGAAMRDGELQINHGDNIEVTYLDVSAGRERMATAVADLVPPLLSGVTVSNFYGRTFIVWQSDEPASSMVSYGSNFSLTLLVSSSALTRTHSLPLDNLVPGQAYQFIVMSADQAGNTSTNNNSGALYSFVSPPVSGFLLVNAYVPDAQSPFIPSGAYTDPLTQIGVTYDTWSVLVNNSLPTLENLRHYRAVIWRISDSYHALMPYSTLGANQQAMIEDYLNEGGAFFMSSMEILLRLGDVPFRSNVLQVAEFVTNWDSVAINGNVQYYVNPDCDQDFGASAVQGEVGDPITDSTEMNLDYANYPTNRFVDDGARRDLADTFTPTSEAMPILTETAAGRIVGIRFERQNLESTGRVVFLSFPLDALPETGPAPNNRTDLLRRILNYLAPGSVPGTIQVSNNLWQATFNVSGPSNFVGLGISNSFLRAPPGEYIVNFGDVPFYDTPLPQTNVLQAADTLLFQGNYTFADANTNGISDAWEEFFFVSVSSNRTSQTDTDDDGHSDYAEFISGTNPTNAASVLHLFNPLMLSNGTALQLQWPAVAGRAYRVLGSTDTTTWTPLSDWTLAATNAASYTTPLPPPGDAFLFRVEVQP